MSIKFSDDLLKILGYARHEALRTGCYGIGVDHLMLGIIRHGKNEAVEAITDSGIKPEDFKNAIDDAVFSETAIPYSEIENVRTTRATNIVIGIARDEALRNGSEEISARHLLLAISLTTGNFSAGYLFKGGINHDRLVKIFAAKDEEKRKEIKFQDIAGALSEQLGNILGTSAKSGFLN